jgi:hypothetical protein
LGDLDQAKFLGLDLVRTASYDLAPRAYDWQYAVEVETSEDLQKNAARSLERRVMVEAARIELASGNATQSGLHA